MYIYRKRLAKAPTYYKYDNLVSTRVGLLLWHLIVNPSNPLSRGNYSPLCVGEDTEA